MSDLVAKWPREKAKQIYDIVQRLNLCACGTNAHWEIILFLLERGNREEVGWQADKGFDSDADDAKGRWVEFSAKVLDSWELLEHGGGIGGSWLTDDGKLLLQFLRDFGTEDPDFNDWNNSACQPRWATSWPSDEDKAQCPNIADFYEQWSATSPERTPR